MARIILLSDPYRWYKLRDRAWTGFRRIIRHKIFSAIESGDDAAVLRMATTRILLRRRGEFGQSPVVEAIAAGRSGLACELIARGGIYPGNGSMAHAAMKGDLLVVEALIRSNKNLDEPSPNDSTSAGYTP